MSYRLVWIYGRDGRYGGHIGAGGARATDTLKHLPPARGAGTGRDASRRNRSATRDSSKYNVDAPVDPGANRPHSSRAPEPVDHLPGRPRTVSRVHALPPERLL